MTKIYLMVFLLIGNDGWRHGDDIYGWAPRLQPSLDICEERKGFAEKQLLPPGVSKMVWKCVQIATNDL